MSLARSRVEIQGGPMRICLWAINIWGVINKGFKQKKKRSTHSLETIKLEVVLIEFVVAIFFFVQHFRSYLFTNNILYVLDSILQTILW